MNPRISKPTSARIALTFAAFMVFMMNATWISAQLAGSAGIGASVPASIGRFEVRGGATVDRIGSGIAPRTTLDVHSTIALPVGSGGGWIGASGFQVREIDTLPMRPFLAAGLWQSFHSLTLRIGAASHGARLGGRAAHDTSIALESVDLQTGERRSYVHSGWVSSVPSRTRMWMDVEAGASWTASQYRVDGIVGSRQSFDEFPRAMWVRLASTMQFSTHVGLVAAAGVQPAQIAIGIPASRFASIALSVSPGRRTTGGDLPPSAAATPFSIRLASAGQYVMTYRVGNAHRVEVSGDFAKWRPVALAETEPGVWMTTMPLAPGTYHMSVRVDGGPWTAPPGTTEVDDDFNGTVGIVVVR